ncbi:arginase [Cohnella zeiphila]|uniref:Arginase n=1 Tax=Cohnella zeiphila TaxID=2761120 RepID=A0A7X0VXD0_9BACL|nr:arginase [Cohnella zeiphila]MBB6731798.1 arginase [Cohnella zeiphila]
MNDRRKVQVIGVPFWKGCGRRGAELGPKGVLQAGLEDLVAAAGAEWAGSVEAKPHVPSGTRAEQGPIRHLTEVRRMASAVADRVSRAHDAGCFPLVVGGDHSVAIGSLAGMTRRRRDLGVVWIDAHGDLNTERTTPSGRAHGIPLAVALGQAEWKLSALPDAAPIRPDRLVLVGTRDLDPGERELIRAEGIACLTMRDIDREGIEAVMERALAIAGRGSEGVHVSLDMDALDPIEAPGVGTPVPGGLSYREARMAMETLAASGRAVSMDLVEVNPRLDPSGRTARLAAELAAALLGRRLL